MKLRNESYEVTVTIDPTYTFGSADNVRYYEHVLVADPLEKGDYYTTFCIRILSGEREYTMALIGGNTDDDSECAVLEGDVLTILSGDIITGIDLAKRRIVRSKKLPHSLFNYALFRIPGGLAVYGELEITGLDREYNVIWQRGARDIINSFQILEDRIEYSDISGFDYVIYFDKALLSDRPNTALRRMTEEEFRSFREFRVSYYAAELMKERNVGAEQARREAQDQFGEVFPNGFETKDSFFMNIRSVNGNKVGWICYQYQDGDGGQKQVFLDNLLILASERRKGFASQAIEMMNAGAKEASCSSSVLFVWDHNLIGKCLFEKRGYKPRNRQEGGICMVKEL